MPSEALERALAWIPYLESHARRVYHTVTNGRLAAAAALAKKITSGKLATPFSARTVQRHEWSGLTDLNDISSGIDTLCDLGWLRHEDVPATVKGGRPTVRYHINPRVLSVPSVSSRVDTASPREADVSAVSSVTSRGDMARIIKEEEDRFVNVARARASGRGLIHTEEVTDKTGRTPPEDDAAGTEAVL